MILVVVLIQRRIIEREG
jgi:hypothetical protein